MTVCTLPLATEFPHLHRQKGKEGEANNCAKLTFLGFSCKLYQGKPQKKLGETAHTATGEAGKSHKGPHGTGIGDGIPQCRQRFLARKRSNFAQFFVTLQQNFKTIQ